MKHKQEAVNSISHLDDLVQQTKNTEPLLSKKVGKLRSALSSEISKKDDPDMKTFLSYDDVAQISQKTIDSVNAVLSNQKSFDDKKYTIREYESEMKNEDAKIHPKSKKMTTEEFIIFLAAIGFICAEFKGSNGIFGHNNYEKKKESAGFLSMLMAIPGYIKEMAESVGKSIKQDVKNFFDPSPFKKSSLTLFSHNIAEELMKIEEVQEQRQAASLVI